MNRRPSAKKLLLLAIALFSTPISAQQQGLDPNQMLPVDPQVTVGTLDNGLTYYTGGIPFWKIGL